MLLKLPNELLLIIGANLTRPRDLRALILTNRHLCFLFLPHLHTLALRPKNGLAPLTWAAKKSYPGLVELLLSKGADVNFREPSGYCQTALSESFLWDSPRSEEVLRILIEKSDLRTRNSRGQTLLHDAAGAGNVLAVKLLLEKGLSPNDRENNGGTPLQEALYHQLYDAVPVLLEAGTDLEIRRDGATALHVAVSHARMNDKEFACIVEMLLDNGADINAQDEDMRTPLHVAVSHARRNDKEFACIVEMLLDNGADINAQDEDLRTPLHVALEGGAEMSVKLLMERKEGMEIRDRNGHVCNFRELPFHMGGD